MIEQDYILLVMNCQKYANKAEIQRSTWLKTLPSYIKYYHVIGDINLSCKYKFDNENNKLWINVEDDYNSLPKKVIRAYEAINDTFDYKYLFKTDDDQMMIETNFFKLIKNTTTSTPKKHYGGFVVNITCDYISDYYKMHPELPKDLVVKKTQYCSGRFYFLSRQAIEYLIYKKELIEKEYFEDYAIGLHLASYYKENIVNINTNDYLSDMIL